LKQIPDGSIANLYPVEDNYVNVGNGTLRSPKSLTDLCTDALCRSLPYLNGELPPGLPQDVVDDVAKSLIQHSALNETTLRSLRNCELGELTLAGCRGVTDSWLEPLSTNTSSFYPTVAQANGIESMDLEDERPSDIFYGSFDFHTKDESSFCSTSSFVSATSNHHIDDHTMIDAPTSPMLMSSEYMESKKRSRCSPARSTSFASSVTTNLTLLDIRGSQNLTDRGLMHLTSLNSLEVAKLDNCHSLTGRGLLAFANSHRLHTLSLANCRRLTDEAVINISHLLSLEALSLDGCRCLTDRSLAAISDLYDLRKLGLSQCDLITNEGLQQLEHLEALEELSLGWCRQITDQGIKTLAGHPERERSLRILRLARCPITDEGVAYLSKLQSLEELDLNGCSNIGSTALGNTLEKLKNLTVLDVSYCPGIM